MKLITLLEGFRNQYDGSSINQKCDLLVEIAEEYELFDTMTQIVADEEINSLVEEHLSIGSSWETIYYMLSGIKMHNQRYYYFNGFHHLENLSARIFYNLLDEFIEEVKFKKLENEEIEKEM